MVNEKDPYGKNQHELGAKVDAGKYRPALVLKGFAKALRAVSEVGTYGATKYTDNGWKEVPKGEERYEEAMLRHWIAESTGEMKDVDTNLLHQAHFCWNALARLTLTINRLEQEKESKQNEKVSVGSPSIRTSAY